MNLRTDDDKLYKANQEATVTTYVMIRQTIRRHIVITINSSSVANVYASCLNNENHFQGFCVIHKREHFNQENVLTRKEREILVSIKKNRVVSVVLGGESSKILDL